MAHTTLVPGQALASTAPGMVFLQDIPTLVPEQHDLAVMVECPQVSVHKVLLVVAQCTVLVCLNAAPLAGYHGACYLLSLLSDVPGIHRVFGSQSVIQ